MHVPDEIWSRIFDNLEVPLAVDGRWWEYDAQIASTQKTLTATLVALCRVSRQFHRIARPILFRSIVEGSDRDLRWLTTLMTTLIKDPSLGQHIRTLAIRNFWINYSDHFQKISDTIKNAETELPYVFKQLFEHDEAVYPYTSDEPVGPRSLILALSPNVTFVECELRPSPTRNRVLGLDLLSGSLNVDQLASLMKLDEDGGELWTTSPPPPECHLGAAEGRGCKFEHLKEVRIRTAGTEEEGNSLPLIEPVLLHPTLETLRIHGIDWRGVKVDSSLRWPQSVSNIKVLELSHCIVDAAGLENILLRCPSLRELTLLLSDWHRDDTEDWEVDLAEFGQILRMHGRHLSVLSLYTTEYKSLRIRWSRPVDTELGSLRELSGLKKLTLAPMDLFGHAYLGDDEEWVPPRRLRDVLPTSIEWLHLYCNDGYCLGIVDEDMAKELDGELLDVITCGQFPNLSKVTVEKTKDLPKGFDFEGELEGWESSVIDENFTDQFSYSKSLSRYWPDWTTFEHELVTENSRVISLRRTDPNA